MRSLRSPSFFSDPVLYFSLFFLHSLLTACFSLSSSACLPGPLAYMPNRCSVPLPRHARGAAVSTWRKRSGAASSACEAQDSADEASARFIFCAIRRTRGPMRLAGSELSSGARLDHRVRQGQLFFCSRLFHFCRLALLFPFLHPSLPLSSLCRPSTTGAFL